MGEQDGLLRAYAAALPIAHTCSLVHQDSADVRGCGQILDRCRVDEGDALECLLDRRPADHPIRGA